MRGRHVLTVSALAIVLVAQATWSAATTSGTYDETTYLRLGRALYTSRDAAAFAERGVAPLPVLLTSAAAVSAGSPSYPRAIWLARASAIALFGVPLVIVTYWTLLHALGPGAAVAGTAFVSLSPNIVAHASLASTDVCFLVAALAALAGLAYHLEEHSRRSRALLGITLAVALAAKYSGLVLFVIVPLAIFATSRIRSKPSAGAAGDGLALTTDLFAAALLFVWVLHAFAMVPLGLPPLESLRLPAPIVGIARQIHHQSVGEPAFLMGRRSPSGWWYHVPAALAMKSTPAELIVGAVALVALTGGLRSSGISGVVWRVAFVVFGVFALANRLALGIRYVLVFIPLSTFLTAEWLVRMVHSDRWRLGVGGGLVALQLFSGASIGPHYLSYVNSLAGGPETGYLKLADSNVDWGQDLPALGAQLTRLAAKHPVLSYFGTAPPDAYGVRADQWDRHVQNPVERWDWVAISATNLAGVFLPADPFADFRALTPDARAGYSILLYSTNREDVRRAMLTAASRLQ